MLAAGLSLPATRPTPPLVSAVKYGNIDTVRALLAKRGDPNAAEIDGTTALHWAAHFDNLAGADLLIKAGARVAGPEPLRRHPALARVHQRQRRDGRATAGGRRRSKHEDARRRHGADDRGAHRQCRRGEGAASRAGRTSTRMKTGKARPR